MQITNLAYSRARWRIGVRMVRFESPFVGKRRVPGEE